MAHLVVSSPEFIDSRSEFIDSRVDMNAGGSAAVASFKRRNLGIIADAIASKKGILREMRDEHGCAQGRYLFSRCASTCIPCPTRYICKAYQEESPDGRGGEL